MLIEFSWLGFIDAVNGLNEQEGCFDFIIRVSFNVASFIIVFFVRNVFVKYFVVTASFVTVSFVKAFFVIILSIKVSFINLF